MADLTKRRSDAWDSPLTEEQRWQLYDHARRWEWSKVAPYIAEEHGLAPSRSAWYRFCDAMRDSESARRLELAVRSEIEAKGLAETAGFDAATSQALIALAREEALTGNTKGAVSLTKGAAMLGSLALNAEALRLKASDQKIKAAALALQREKWEAAEKRLAAVKNAVAEARKGGGLTPETLAKIEEAAGLL